jgi:hypothetical protein
MICNSFYELSFSGSCSYITDIFAFSKISNNETCKARYGYVLRNVPSGCANDGFTTGKQDYEIINDINYVESLKTNKTYEVFEYTPQPIIENIQDFITAGLSWGYAPTMIGPISDSPFAYSKSLTSIPSSYWITSLFRPDSPYAEFWATFSLSEEDIFKAIGKEVKIINILSLSASVKASWNYFEYMSGAYIAYPFYNWALVLNTSTQCTLRPGSATDAIYFNDNGIPCDQVGRDFTNPIKPAWDFNFDCLQYLKARNKSCSPDMTQIKSVEIPKIYGNYRMGVVFDWKRWSRYNPNGVNSLDFTGAYATPSITFKIAYVQA